MTTPSILIVSPVAEPFAPLLADLAPVYILSQGPPIEAQAQVRVIVASGGQPFDRRLAESLPNLGLIACFTTGHDGVDLDWAAERGYQVSYAPGQTGEDVADHALGLMLGVWRELFAGERRVRAGGWRADDAPTRSMTGVKVGVVGLGDIGWALAERCQALKTKIAWWGPGDKPAAPWPRAESLLALAKDSDILVVCAASTPHNRGLISREVIEALGAGGLLVNIARGSLVDEDALAEALREGRLGAAALDVLVEEPPSSLRRWQGLDNLVITPHTAGFTDRSLAVRVKMLREEVARFLRGEPLANPAPPPRTAAK